MRLVHPLLLTLLLQLLGPDLRFFIRLPVLRNTQQRSAERTHGKHPIDAPK
jgi:hypothetical protein